MMKNDIRIAAVVLNCPVGRIADNLERMADWVKAAKKKGVDVICFPEMNISGYSSSANIKKIAETVPGKISQSVSEMAQSFDIAILAGLAEADLAGRVFASHLVATAQGVVGIYRKIHIAPPESQIFTAGDAVPLFDINGFKLGIQLCYDAHFPELSTRMATEGADAIFMPHASPRNTPAEKFDSWMRHLSARAFDNSLFVIACNQTGNNQNELNFPGLAIVLDPAGHILKKDIGGKENLMVADLKARDLEEIRGHRMRYFLPNRRPDLY
ncbi:MAG: nitrilase-related carbon-nitrogen hydrolase [Desulfobacterales bacterium]|jgi:N-carbamoylputrescine amidase